jgi:filamentous hemagglutinin family protein
MAAVLACFIAGPVLSNPTNPNVVNGTASFNQAGKVLNVTNSNGAIINWNTFSIGAGETTRFIQTSASSSVLNRVLSNNPSLIYGTLTSNGRVWLINQSGIMVGAGGVVDVAGFVASTMNLRNEDFLAGRNLFVNDGNAQNVINQGEIRTPSGGSVYLIGSNVTNEGIIHTPAGETILAAGQTVSLIDSATPGVKVDITGAAGNATNLGSIVAEAGRIGMAGVLVRNSGLVNASSVVNEGGRIFLKATKSVVLDGTSIIRADAGDTGNGGNVLVWGDETAAVDGVISARGGSLSGDGGFVETSAYKLKIVGTARITTRAPHGTAGTWLLDPYDFTIASSGGDITGADLSVALDSNDVVIQTNPGSVSCTGATCGPGDSGGNGDIFVNDGISWSSAFGLTLSAYRNIEVNQSIGGGAGSTVVLHADNTGTGTGTVIQGVNGIVDTGAVRHLRIYYNPASYSVPTDFSALTTSGIGPYFAWMLVNDENDLQAISTNPGGVFALGRNINAIGTSGWNSGAGFAPVGDMATAFTGQLDGLGHTISGLAINRPATDHVGLFGYASGAVIKNVTLNASTISGQHYVGGLVGTLDGGSIVNSNADGDIAGVQGVGGLAGQLTGNAAIINSGSSGTVSATDTQGNAGGLVGLMACCGSPTIQASFSSADVSGIGNLGGLVGWQQKGTIDGSSASGPVAGSGDNVGGLVGKAGQGNVSSPAGISNSSATGVVGGASNVGGLVGENTEYSVVLGSDSSGNVSGSGNNIGGLVGNNVGSIVDSLAAPATVTGVLDVGGLVGFNSDIGVVANSHFNFDGVMIKGAKRVTEGALYSAQYLDWFNNGKSLSIGNYSANLSLNGGYYEISGVAGLKDLLGFANSSALKFRLTGDIDLSADAGLHIPYFSALELDGAGHTVTGLNLSLTNSHVAFIGRLDAGTVKNIGIAGGSVSGQGGVGGLVGLNSGGTVSNAYSTATITGGSGYDIGGLVGYNKFGTVVGSYATGNVTGNLTGSSRTGGLVGANFGTITGSHATGTVRGWREVGGLAGGQGGDVSNSYATGPVIGTGNDVGGLVGHVWYGSISDSYATGSVSGSGLHTGGLIGYHGYNAFNPSLIRSYATGTVTGGSWYTGGLIGGNEGTVANSYALGQVTGGSGVGGLVGLNTLAGAVSRSYATGSATGTPAGGYDVGGLVGENRGAVTDSYATGAAYGYSDRVGGLAGYNAGAIGKSYATGLVTTGGGPNVGGLVGENAAGTVINSFWDMNTTGRAVSAGGGTGLSTAQMKTAAIFTAAGWSPATWNLADGAYPTLTGMPGAPGCIGYDNCWTGVVNSLWAIAGNWSAGHIPTASETVKIEIAGTPTISIIGVNPSFGSLWLAENLNVDAGVSFSLSSLFTLASGTATFDGVASIPSYVQTGGVLAGSGTFIVANNFTQTGGSINRSGNIAITHSGNLQLGDIATTGTFSAIASGRIFGSAHRVRGDAITLVSQNGGAAGSTAIDLDVEAGSALTANINVGAAHGGIRLRNFGVSAPATIALTDSASSQASVAFYQDSDLSLAGKTFNAGTGGIVIGTGGSMTGIAATPFGGTPAQLTLIADGDMSLGGALNLPSTHIGLGAEFGTLTIGQPLTGLHVALQAATLQVVSNVTASGDLAIGGGTVNISAPVSAQDIALGANTLHVGPGGSLTATNQGVAHVLVSVTGNADIDGGYIKTTNGDLQMIVGGNLGLANGGHIWAGYMQMTAPFADASIAVGGNLTLNNGSHINAANDIFIDMLGANSVLALNGGPGGASYILSDIGTGIMATTHLAFLNRSAGGVLIDGVETTMTTYPGSGFYAIDTNTPALPGAGLEINYAQQVAGNSTAAQLVDALNKAVEDATPIDLDVRTGFDTALGDDDEATFGDDDERERQKREGGKDERKNEKAALKKFAQCL